MPTYPTNVGYPASASYPSSASYPNSASYPGNVSGFVPPVTSGLVESLIGENNTVSDLANVPSWPDASGIGNNAVQATSSKQPIFHKTGGSNSRACVTFDGVDDFMQAAFSLPQPFTVVIVGKYTNAFVGQDRIIDGFNANGCTIARASTTAVFMLSDSSTQTNSTVTTTSWHSYICVFNGASSAFYIDGVSQTITSQADGTAGGITLAARGTTFAQNGAVSLSTVLVYSRAITSPEITSTKNSISTFYGTP